MKAHKFYLILSLLSVMLLIIITFPHYLNDSHISLGTDMGKLFETVKVDNIHQQVKQKTIVKQSKQCNTKCANNCLQIKKVTENIFKKCLLGCKCVYTKKPTSLANIKVELNESNYSFTLITFLILIPISIIFYSKLLKAEIKRDDDQYLLLSNDIII